MVRTARCLIRTLRVALERPPGVAVPLAACIYRAGEGSQGVGRHRRTGGSGKNTVRGFRQRAGGRGPEGPAGERRRG